MPFILLPVRCGHSFSVFLLAGSLTAQVTSVQNGDWYDATTWDCGCVPPGLQVVNVAHAVHMTGNYLFTNPLVHVLPTGDLYMTEPHSVAILEAFSIEGSVHWMGDVDVDNNITLGGYLQVEGDFHNDGDLQLTDADARISVIGNFANAGQILGTSATVASHICVTGTSSNTGAISGLLDYCDVSPTTDIPPLLDENTGTVEASVTFCELGSCTSFVPVIMHPLPQVRVDASRCWLEVTGLPQPPVSVLLTDVSGRVLDAKLKGWSDHFSFGIPELRSGAYLLVLGDREPAAMIVRFLVP